MRVITLFLLLSVSLPACGDDTGSITLDMNDSGTTIDVMVGDVVTIELESNPSTGYSWVLPDDLDGVELRDERWVGDSDLVGSPGISRLELEVVDEGTRTLHVEYRRPWETDGPAERVFTITIVAG
jgi:inhibitor of cysteine peptidase